MVRPACKATILLLVPRMFELAVLSEAEFVATLELLMAILLVVAESAMEMAAVAVLWGGSVVRRVEMVVVAVRSAVLRVESVVAIDRTLVLV